MAQLLFDLFPTDFNLMAAFRYSERFCLICSPRISASLAAFRYSERFCLICFPRISASLAVFRYSNKSYKKSSK